MTVAELIEKLQSMPQDAKVIITEESGGKWDNEVRDVILNTPQNTMMTEKEGCVELDNWPAEGYLDGPKT